jgi:hypothetical protein
MCETQFLYSDPSTISTTARREKSHKIYDGSNPEVITFTLGILYPLSSIINNCCSLIFPLHYCLENNQRDLFHPKIQLIKGVPNENATNQGPPLEVEHEFSSSISDQRKQHQTAPEDTEIRFASF